MKTRMTLTQAKKLLPVRARGSNKTHGGKTLIIAGSPGFYGAGILAAIASARVGSGYTYLMADPKKFPSSKHPDFLIKDSKFSKWSEVDAIALGPGLGVSRATEKLIRKLLKDKFPNVVLDADALTVLAKKQIYPLPESWILTPHTGELKRLMGRESTAKEAQSKYGCHILLKGPNTCVINSHQQTLVSEGTTALAKAGTGDVLTGIIAGLLAQKLDSFDAASLGAFIHGKCSQYWERKKRDHLSLLASDLFEIIPVVMNQIRGVRHAHRA